MEVAPEVSSQGSCPRAGLGSLCSHQKLLLCCSVLWDPLLRCGGGRGAPSWSWGGSSEAEGPCPALPWADKDQVKVVVTLKTLRCEASPPLLSARSCISSREAAVDSKSFLRETNRDKKGFKNQCHFLSFPGVSWLLALEGELYFLICANTKFIFVWAIMCKIMGNPSGWSEKPSQIFQETFQF